MLGLPGFAVVCLLEAAAYGLTAWLYRKKVLRCDLHRDVLAVGALILATIAFFWPLFFTSSWIPKGGGDLSSFIYPIYAFGARWLKRGVIPLWNPHLYMGMPFAADNQTGLFYPINLLFFLLTPQLTFEAVELMAVGHVFLAGLFTYLFLRDLPSLRSSAPVGRMAAVAGSIAFMFSDLFVVHLGNLNIIATATWLPLTLFCFRRALDRSRWGWVVWSGIALGVTVSVGHAQMFLYVGMSLGLYVLFQLYLSRRAGWKVVLVMVGKLALTGAIAFGLAAVALIPAFDLPKYTIRASLTYSQASEFAIPPAGLIGLFLPGFWGRGTGPFWGPWLRTEMGYVGVLPLILAAIGVVLTFRRSSLTRFWLLLGGLGFSIALGSSAALHGWTYALIPMFRQLRVPARAIFLFDFSVAVLAAQGLDCLLHPLSRPARRVLRSLNRGLLWIGGGLTLVGLPLLGHAVLVSRAMSADVLTQMAVSLGSLVFFLVLFSAGMGWLALRRHGLARPAVLGVSAVCLIAFDLLSLGAYVEIEPNSPLVGYQIDPVLGFLKSDPEPFRVEVLPGAPVNWAPDWALIHEMDDWGGIWNPLRLGAYDVLTWAGIDRQTPYYNLYNIKYIIADRETAVPAHWEVAFTHEDGVVYRNPRALPRACMIYKAEVVNGQTEALNAARRGDLDPWRQVVLEKGFDVVPLDAAPGDGEQRVEIVGRGPNHLDLHVVTPVEGYLFVSEMWMPDWVALVDGQEREVARADFTFRAVHLQAGEHTVHMVYRPRLWFWGAGITLVTIIALVAWNIGRLWRRYRTPRRCF